MAAIKKSIGEYLAALAVEGKADMTISVYNARLRRFANWCMLHPLSRPFIYGFKVDHSLHATFYKGHVQDGDMPL
jgi:hypothetical protein